MKRILAKAGMALVAGLLLFTGCSNPLTGKPETGEPNENRGLVQIQVGSPVRTLQPALTGFTKYELDFAGPQGATHAQEVLTGTSATVELSPGAWTITVGAFAGSGEAAVKAAEGSAEVTVTAGQTATAAITLTPYTGEGTKTGTFTYTVDYPAGLNEAHLFIAKADGTALSNGTINLLAGENKKTGTLALDAGSYRIQVQLKQGDLIAGKTESLHIYPTLTTALTYTFTHADFVAFAEVADVTLSGTAQLDNGGAAVNGEVQITLYNEGFAEAILQDDPITWISNLPAGLSVAAESSADAGGREITLKISGTPTAASSEELAVTIPGDALVSGKALTVRNNPEAKFDIGLPAATAVVKDVALTVETGRLLNGEVEITVTNETFTGISADTDLTSWFEDLPATLSAAAKSAVASGGKTLTIAVAGTPAAVYESKALSITIPGTSLSRGEALTVTANDNATLTVAENSMTGVYIVGVLGPSASYTGKYWKYTKSGDKVTETDFTPGEYSRLAVVGDDVYLAGKDNEYSLYKKNDDTIKDSVTSVAIPFMAVDETGVIYMATNNSLWKMTDQGFPDASSRISVTRSDGVTGNFNVNCIAVDETYLYLGGMTRTPPATYRTTYWKYDKSTLSLVESVQLETNSYNNSRASGIAVTGDALYLAGYIQGTASVNNTRRAACWIINKNSGKPVEQTESEYESIASAITVSGEGDVYLTGYLRKPSQNNGANEFGATAAYWKLVAGSLEKHDLDPQPIGVAGTKTEILSNGLSIAVDGTDVYVAGLLTTDNEHRNLKDPVPIYWKHPGGTGDIKTVRLAETGAAASEARAIIVK